MAHEMSRERVSAMYAPLADLRNMIRIFAIYNRAIRDAVAAAGDRPLEVIACFANPFVLEKFLVGNDNSPTLFALRARLLSDAEITEQFPRATLTSESPPPNRDFFVTIALRFGIAEVRLMTSVFSAKKRDILITAV